MAGFGLGENEMKMILAALVLLPLAARAADTRGPKTGPGCGGVTAPVAGFTFTSPFGDLSLQEEGDRIAAYVGRAEIERKHAGAAVKPSVCALEGQWRRVLTLKEGEALASYSPAVSAYPVWMTFIAGAAHAPQGVPTLDTPFGSGYRPGDAKELRSASIDNRILSGHGGLTEAKAGLDGDYVAVKIVASNDNAMLAERAAETTYTVSCKLLSDKDLLCKIVREYSDPFESDKSRARRVRVEYAGFKRVPAANAERAGSTCSRGDGTIEGVERK
jgi:hypothetical protein